jgi:hypothetical protein
MNMKLIKSLTLAGVLLAGAAFAQEWATDTSRGAIQHSGNIVSSTTLKAVKIDDVRSNVVNVNYLDSAGRILVTDTKTAVSTSWVSSSVAAPVPYYAVKVSPTALSGTDAVSATVQQLPASGYAR